MSDWLELELADRLAPVRAPEELWRRLNARPAAPRRAAAWRPGAGIWAWATAAAIAATVIVATFAVHSPTISQLAAAELAKSMPADFRSADPREIETWLREHADVAVAIPQGTRVQLTGARTFARDGVTLGEVLYRVGGREAVLLVGRAGMALDAPERHGAAAWKAHGQIYALAYAGDSQAACRLCHLD
jgi:hypothetical protein